MPLRKVGRPEDIAAAIVYLASDRLAGHVSGQTMVVAGGMGRTAAVVAGSVNGGRRMERGRPGDLRETFSAVASGEWRCLASVMICPACGGELATRKAGAVEVDVCDGGCGGLGSTTSR